jgi:hypothetical protein
MYPDSRQSAFGIVDGRLLNFSIADDRVAAVEWCALAFDAMSFAIFSNAISPLACLIP